MKCSTGKVRYLSRAIAEEALIEVRGRFHFRESNGPVGVYQCDICGDWHFTSKGPANERLSEPDTRSQMDHQREAEYWSRKFRR